MATWAIGDIQGCHAELLALLKRIEFDRASDRLWFTGDLVNRGPESLATLRFVRDLGEAAVTVLGNHDLHLLAVAYGHSDAKSRDTFHDILDAPDCRDLMNWLRQQPLAMHDETLGWLMTHAGIPPEWTGDDALRHAREVENILKGDDPDQLLTDMYGNQPDRWTDSLSGMPRWRYIINAFTRMRYCHADGRLDFHEKGPPGSQPDGLLPWFDVPGRCSAGEKIVFGHWSSLGQIGTGDPAVVALDTGCLWGGKLTALRLDADSDADTRAPAVTACVDGSTGTRLNGQGQ